MIARYAVAIVFCLGVSRLTAPAQHKPNPNFETYIALSGSTAVVANHTKVPICLEVVLGTQHPAVPRTADSIADYTRDLESLGFQCVARNDVLLVRDPALKTITGNPLEHEYDGFSFEGTLLDLHSALLGYIRVPGSTGVSVLRSPEYNRKVRIHIREKLPYREILMRIAAQERCRWQVKYRVRTTPAGEKVPEWVEFGFSPMDSL